MYLILVLVVLVVYSCKSSVSKFLRDNKGILICIVIGFILCSFTGMRMEGMGGTVPLFGECTEDSHCKTIPSAIPNNPLYIDDYTNSRNLYHCVYGECRGDMRDQDCNKESKDFWCGGSSGALRNRESAELNRKRYKAECGVKACDDEDGH